MTSRTLPSTSRFNLEECTTDIDDITLSEISEKLNDPPPLSYIFKECKTEISEALNNHSPLSDIGNEQCEINSDEENIQNGPEIPSCSSCAKKNRFNTGHDVTKGTHIVFGKYFFWDKINSAVRTAAKFLSKDENFFLYYHHGIVSEVVETSEFTAKVKLIEFTSVGSMTYKVIESEIMEIDVRDKNIFYRDYAFRRYETEEIVKRAKNLVGIDSYNLLSHNCENIAVWCISGENESFQSSSFVDGSVKQIFSWAGSILGKITQKLVSNVASNLPKVAKFSLLSIPCLAIASVFFVIELIVSLLRFVELKNQKQRGLICTVCYNKKKILLISKIALSVFATVALAAVPVTGKGTIAILCSCLGIVAVYVLPYLCMFLYRKVKCLINPLYEVQKMVVRKAEYIRPGCVLTMTGGHAILIKNVTLFGASNTFVGLDIVHYQYRGIVGKRTVINERFNFEFKEDLLQVFDVPANDAYPDDEVVKKAKEKAENREQEFNMFWYRSSHMSEQCKVRDISKKFTSKRDVQTGSGVKEGDMVNFRYLGLPHVGIVVGKSFDDVVNLEFYHVNEKGVVESDEKLFDLGSGKIQKLIYPEGDVDAILNDAETQLGQSVHSFRPYKSSRFVQNCIMPKKNDC